MKFCAVRWIENAKVAARAIEILPHLKKWVHETKTAKTKVLEEIRRHFSDPMLLAKLHFFKSIALQLEPFLTAFQTAKPMFPFLFERIEQLMRSLMIRFVKEEKILNETKIANILKIDLENSENLRTFPDVGFGACNCLKGVNQSVKLNFAKDCVVFLKILVTKLKERNPMRYSIVRCAGSLSPNLIKAQPSLARKRMSDLLLELVSAHRISEETGDKAKEQFDVLMTDKQFLESVSNFICTEDRLDHFYATHLNERTDMDALWCAIRKVLILSHGNASVESGFSINKNLMVQNLEERSLIAQRLVYDTIKLHGGPLKVPITKEVEKCVKFARQRYRTALEAQKDSKRNNPSAAKRKADAEVKLKELAEKRIALLVQLDTRVQERAILREMASLKKIIE